jgi:hypothetical protein
MAATDSALQAQQLAIRQLQNELSKHQQTERDLEDQNRMLTDQLERLSASPQANEAQAAMAGRLEDMLRSVDAALERLPEPEEFPDPAGQQRPGQRLSSKARKKTSDLSLVAQLALGIPVSDAAASRTSQNPDDLDQLPGEVESKFAVAPSLRPPLIPPALPGHPVRGRMRKRDGSEGKE